MYVYQSTVPPLLVNIEFCLTNSQTPPDIGGLQEALINNHCFNGAWLLRVNLVMFPSQRGNRP